MKLIAKGAEADLYLVDGKLIKERIGKGYRDKELDKRLRRLRTQREAKLLENAKKAGMAVPGVLKTDSRTNSIIMEYVDGRPLKEFFDSAPEKDLPGIAGKVGEAISRMHDANIVHNDLTSSNMLLSGDKVVFIDFGLGATSVRVEDKAMDLVVLKKSLLVAHTGKFEAIWRGILNAYDQAGRHRDEINRMAVIEKRARYSCPD